MRSVLKTEVSQPRQRLIREMQRINFGHIKGLAIENGDPVFMSSTQSILNMKFGLENGCRPEVNNDDFTLKKKVCELFDAFEALKNGTIHRLEIQKGLPIFMQVEEVNA
jgi:hypothetical protein